MDNRHRDVAAVRLHFHRPFRICYFLARNDKVILRSHLSLLNRHFDLGKKFNCSGEEHLKPYLPCARSPLLPVMRRNAQNVNSRKP